MATTRVHRYLGPDELAEEAATRLVAEIVRLQAHQGHVNLCLAGGRTANLAYEAFANKSVTGNLDPRLIDLWWSSERFVDTADPDRNSTTTLSLIGRMLQVPAAQVHPMPAKSGHADPGEAAYAYAAELGDTVFDLALLGMGADGHVAAIFPQHSSMAVQASTSLLAIGVTDAPVPPAERISLTIGALNRSQEVWFFVTGAQKADAFAKVMAGDQGLPAALVHGQQVTRWFVDAQAAQFSPQYRCSL